jgi:hypothetical protein
MELVKGSLHTFLNAMTYPDKTVYPVASYNEQDFKNLMSVYMDAVFHPNIYKEEKIFKQEGWHYELDSIDGDITINGVVYNEMKGVFSSVDGVVDRVGLSSVFPDTTYNYESGGEPEIIPSLTYEDYLNFHRKYYHPSNSYIYLYGDMDVEERLEWIDREYLSHYDYLNVDSEIELQKPFEKPVIVEKEYAITDSEKEEESAVLSANFVVGDCRDIELDIAFQVLEYAIMNMPGAPLKKALIDAGIGKDITGHYEDEVLQPVYSIVAKFADQNQKEEFVKVIDNTMKELVENGIDKTALKAGLNSLEFKIKEADFGGFPKGLIWGLNLMSTWLYDENKPFVSLETNRIFDKIRELIDTDYFEKIIEKYFIKNSHRSLVVMVPKKGLTQKKEEQQKQQMAKLKESMSKSQLDKIIKDTAELKEYQQTPSTKEELETIPLLEISDIDKDPKPLIYKEERLTDYVAVYNDIFTNGIGYLDLSFDISDLPVEYLPYIGLLKQMLGMVNTDRTYTDLNTDVDINLGGISFDVGIYTDSNTEQSRYQMEVHTKAIYKQLKKAVDIIKEILTRTDFSEEKRIKELLDEVKSKLNRYIMESGHVAGRMRAAADYSEKYYIREQLTGMDFYSFVCDLCNDYENRKDDLICKLNQVVKYVFRKDNLIMNYAGNKESFEETKEYITELIKGLNPNVDFKPHFNGWEFESTNRNEGFITSGQVQYVSRCGNFKDEHDENFDGTMRVLSNIMSSEYLWNNIRVLGGAYGCMINITRSGDVLLSSYRDPNLKRTSDVYMEAADYIENFEADDREMRKYIIGAISSADTPLSAAERSAREFLHYMSNTTFEMLKEERNDILNATADKIRKLAPYLRKAMSQNHICVIGSESMIMQDKDLLNEIRELD